MKESPSRDLRSMPVTIAEAQALPESTIPRVIGRRGGGRSWVPPDASRP
jgi:hypothetical protein